VRSITDKEKHFLLFLKENAQYRDKGSYSVSVRELIRTRESILFKILVLYLRFKNWNNSFKSKYFRNHVFVDCPLSSGEVRSAIRYGRRNDLLFVVSGSTGNFSYKVKGVDF